MRGIEGTKRLSTVYGPVSSWRFGRSLGIDVIATSKWCTFNCIYCQLGRTKDFVSGPDELVGTLATAPQVLHDLEGSLKRIDPTTVDVVTFSGSGEPTLNLELGTIAKGVKRLIGGKPLVVLTNASLLDRDDVRRNLYPFDIVVAKLDAGDDTSFQLINRPVDKKLTVATLCNSIEQLRREFSGRLALEVMLLSTSDGHVTNIEGRALSQLLDRVIKVKPDLVQLDVPYRPPSESFVRCPSQETVRKITQSLAKWFHEDELWVYSRDDKREESVRWSAHTSLERDVLNLLERRPCRIIDISRSLGIDSATARSTLIKLEGRKVVAVNEADGDRYYSPAS